ncbi:MAG: gliding motility-associated C-terminal domain-containing protein [Bacteroidota bacterium]
MKIKFALAFLLLVCAYSITNAQVSSSTCPNSDFSENNFNNWTGCYGDFTSPCTTAGFATGRHTIISTPGVDPMSCGGLQMIPTGVNRTVRLGNSDIGAEAERLTYDIAVDTNINGLYVYRYAVVLEDPDDGAHLPTEMPKFEIRILDQFGNVMTDTCSRFTYYVGMPGYTPNTCNIGIQVVKWFDWRTVGLSLKAYHGQNIKVQFTTYDCALTGHFGYAYFNTQCLPRQLKVKYCLGDSTVNLVAPYGFLYQWSPGGATTQSISVTNPLDSSVYSCILTSQANSYCVDTLKAIILPAHVFSEFTFNNGCMGLPIQFNHTSTYANAPVVGWYWDFGDPGSVDNNLIGGDNPTHIFQNPGTYTVTLMDTTLAGCRDTITHTVFVSPPPVMDFVTTVNPTCEGIIVSADNTSTNFNSFNWTFSDGYTSTESHAETMLMYGTDTVFIQLIAQNTYCIDTLIQAIAIDMYTGIVGLPPPNVFTPNGDGKNDCYQLKTAPEMANCYTLKIFNRWGKLVFEKDEANPCWNGNNMSSGAKVPDGVYYYILEFGQTKYRGAVHVVN